ncbi:MAG: hypothetical protein LBR12_06085, partial [Opitutaceae bacterium]|nr:hypothetical protein [Opitutaceae bacterium]
GDAFAQNGFTFYLDADFSNVHVGSYGATDNFGDTATGGSKDNTAYLHNQLYNSSFAANLFLDGDLFSDPSAVYSLNINNIGGSVSITDWTLYKQNCSSVGFLLFTVTGAMDQGTWNLLGLNASDGWSLSWMDNAEGHHQLWLFYANPTRIPEPATTALLLGLLALAALFLFHHKGHKGFPKGHKAPNL